MAEQQHEPGVGLDQNQFCCSVCLDLLKEPVTIQCGHNYCKDCIEGCWDQEEEKGEFSCPQCRETFTPRPGLRRNTMLAEVVEKLKKPSTQQAPPPAGEACVSPGDIACDFCCATGRNKATMSCLTCLASYCPAHLKPHYSVPVLKRHQLVSAIIPLQEKMCTKHNKLMEVYCQTDKKCVCYLCVIDEHRCHRTVSAAAERAEKQKQLIVNLKKVREREEEREKDLNELVQALKDFKSCSQTALKTTDKIFDKLISSIKKQRALAEQLIKAQEKTAVAQAEKLQLQLMEEIDKLRRTDSELEQLSHMDDHVLFIQMFQSLSSTSSCESPDLPPDPVIRSQRWFTTMSDGVSKLRNDVESLMRKIWPSIAATVSAVDVVLPPVPKTRDQLLRYCCPLTLDVNSASRCLYISEEGQRVTVTTQQQYYSYHAERFTAFKQVLCKEGLSDRYYWEVKCNHDNFSVAVAYKNISRTSSDESQFGKNNKSWSLECHSGGYSFQHNQASIKVSGPVSYRIGVFLDYEAGTLSFYSISDTMTLLHREQTKFTQPLYPGLRLNAQDYWSSLSPFAELIKLW